MQNCISRVVANEENWERRERERKEEEEETREKERQEEFRKLKTGRVDCPGEGFSSREEENIQISEGEGFQPVGR